MQTIRVDGNTRVLVLTGAGASAESGIPTFRDADGLWEKHPIEQVATPEGFDTDPALVWRFYSQRRAGAATCAPNPGHAALAALEQSLGDRFLLATQNVDGLHRRAGSSRLIEMHGNLFQTRCSVCDLPPFDDTEVYEAGNVPFCGRCQAKGTTSILRPHIVWFGEMLDPTHLTRIHTFMTEAQKTGRWVFVAAGTSGVVYPAAGLVDSARRFGAETWLVNLETADNTGRFDHVVRGRTGEVLPALFDVQG